MIIPPLGCGAVALLASACLDSVARTPREVAGLAPARLVAAAGDHTCALLRDGTVACWGANDVRQGGLPGGDLKRPRPIPLPPDPTTIALGPRHGCAAFADGTVRCWGDDGAGALGVTTGSCADRGRPDAGAPACGPVAPALVPGLEETERIAAGGPAPFTCAVRRDRTPHCWGHGAQGQLGPGPRPKVRPKPERVADEQGVALRDVLDVAAGDAHACAVVGRAVWCWGTPPHGPALRGDGAAPFDVQGGAVRVSVGKAHRCALTAAGEVHCWGWNLNGQCGPPGDGGGAPVAETGAPCEAREECVPRPRRVVGVARARAIAAGGRHSCAVAEEGTVICWGSNEDGQLGAGEPTLSRGPARVALPEAAVEVSAGEAHTCAVLVSGRVFCWGSDAHGQIGNDK